MKILSVNVSMGRDITYLGRMLEPLSPGWRGSFEERLVREGAPIEYRDGSGPAKNVAGLDRVPERAGSRLRRDS